MLVSVLGADLPRPQQVQLFRADESEPTGDRADVNTHVGGHPFAPHVNGPPAREINDELLEPQSHVTRLPSRQRQLAQLDCDGDVLSCRLRAVLRISAQDLTLVVRVGIFPSVAEGFHGVSLARKNCREGAPAPSRNFFRRTSRNIYFLRSTSTRRGSPE